MSTTNRNKRQFLHTIIKAGQCCLVYVSGLTALPRPASSDYPLDAFRSESVSEVLQILFGTTDAGEDGGINIELSPQAESRQRIPFRITAPYTDKIALLVEQNRHPLVLTVDSNHYANGVIIGTMDLAQSSVVSVYTFRQQQLYKHSRRLRVPVSAMR